MPTADFSPRRGGFLQLLGMTLPPCCPYQPRRSVSPHQSLATIHAAFARKVRARPSGCSTLEAIWVHLRYGPVARLPSLRDGFVNRLQDYQFPSFLLFKLRGSGLLPRWDSHPLFMPAFAGRTLPGTNPQHSNPPCLYHILLLRRQGQSARSGAAETDGLNGFPELLQLADGGVHPKDGGVHPKEDFLNDVLDVFGTGDYAAKRA